MSMPWPLTLKLPADLVRERNGGDDLAHQRAFLALVAQFDGRLLLHVAHPLLNLRAGEALLHLIPRAAPAARSPRR